MLEKLCRVQMAEEVRHTGKTVAHAFVPAHVFAPDPPPVGIAQRRGVAGTVWLEPFRLDADERRGRPHEDNRERGAARRSTGSGARLRASAKGLARSHFHSPAAPANLTPAGERNRRRWRRGPQRIGQLAPEGPRRWLLAPLCWIAMDADGSRWMRVPLWGNSGGTVRCAQADDLIATTIDGLFR